jgi:hypothetical protein
MSQDDMLDSVMDSAKASGNSPEPERSRSLGDDWYLISSQALEAGKTPVQEESSIWGNSKKSILAATLAAALVGAAAAWLVLKVGTPERRVTPQAVQHVSTPPALNSQEATPVKASSDLPAQSSTLKTDPAANEDEFARLRTENRRLLALVEVLRQRSRAHQNCSAADQSSTPTR